MKEITSNNKEDIPLLAWLTMFGDKTCFFNKEKLVLGTISGFRSGLLKKIYFKEITYLEQNKYTSSEFASRAKKGHKILWIIKGQKYLGRVEDGKIYMY